ncbi:exonuclease SbcCD subunit D C-terminal domain-containing protein [Pedobacter cryoconitis]|uniref:exonuclease SbcCD subunit D C-terminal domain-containing protein n=1 Tax=Pedobacter cryoconitis TaxID=188932 RepID=UPI00161BE214|nr:exonuclease SbcCD subunit D C-terminal domain-containing protein [Pedobacter cryoconitis]MBB5644363.1 exonuclease SbcD [Pedobacter cryoconitis]
MRILHTADWHLGKRLEQSERTDEHQAFLDWLILTLQTENIDVLIVAGDVFDTGSPSNTAFEQYYGFLRRVKDTNCREVIIIGGNHDSISTLNAPSTLLKYFNVHIIGGVPEEFTDQIIEIHSPSGELELVVCAVPFLRDRDIRLSVSGETAEERETRIKQGICDHYHRFKEYIGEYKANHIPVIATGHLFAAGSSTSDSEKEIHVGNLGQVGGDQFPVEFDYVALGHIHRPQVINQMNHIRYSGSPIPLSFSETDDRKQVIVLEFEKGELVSLVEVEVPGYRKLIRIKGDFEKVKTKLVLLEDPGTLYPAWVEVQVETETFIFDLEEQLNTLIVNKPFIERLFPRQLRTRAVQNLDGQTHEAMALTDLDPQTVFLKRCEAEYPEEDHAELLLTFKEVLEYMAQKENKG